MTTSAPRRSFGREAFGDDPANYHVARPHYPEATWQALSKRANLGPGVEILEIGAGTGLQKLRVTILCRRLGAAHLRRPIAKSI
jgi:hypothetical protein